MLAVFVGVSVDTRALLHATSGTQQIRFQVILVILVDKTWAEVWVGYYTNVFKLVEIVFTVMRSITIICNMGVVLSKRNGNTFSLLIMMLLLPLQHAPWFVDSVIGQI